MSTFSQKAFKYSCLRFIFSSYSSAFGAKPSGKALSMRTDSLSPARLRLAGKCDFSLKVDKCLVQSLVATLKKLSFPSAQAAKSLTQAQMWTFGLPEQAR